MSDLSSKLKPLCLVQLSSLSTWHFFDRPFSTDPVTSAWIRFKGGGLMRTVTRPLLNVHMVLIMDEVKRLTEFHASCQGSLPVSVVPMRDLRA